MERDFETTLRDLPRSGKLIKDRHYRQVWRFEHRGRPFYLKFYPIGGWRDWIRRRFRGSPALREFQRLQWLQKNAVPAPRAVAALLGFRIEDRKGDAVIIEALEPSAQLDRYVHQFHLAGEAISDRRRLAGQLITLIETLGKAGLGHSDLHLGNIVMANARLHLLDAYAVHRGGLTMDDISLLAFSVGPYATRTDFARAWRRLGPGGPMPDRNPREPAFLAELLQRVFKNDRYSGHLAAGPWRGHFFKHSKFPQRWAPASRLDISEKDWREAWPILLQQMQSDQFEVLKRTRSGDVLAGEIILGGRPVPVVIKRPRRKYWRRYLTEIGRGMRCRRAWTRSWQLIVRNIPTAWPLLFMEKTRLGYATDAIIVFERIEGRMLSAIRSADEEPQPYHALLHRCGALLRRLEATGLHLYDAKAENWMVREDEKLGLYPMLVDVDGIRRIRQDGGLKRLLRSLRENSQIGFTDADALALARGYAPFARAEDLWRLADVQATPTAAVRAASGEE